MDDIALLERVLDRTVALVGSIRDDQWAGPTPCPDYDVRGLVGHVAGWAPVFAAAAQGEHFQGDPSAYEVGPATVDDLRTEAERIVAGWREDGQERQVTMVGSDFPGSMVLAMTLMEYATHGWDLATATGQEPGYADADVEETLDRARRTLPAEYRGEGKPFGDIVTVPDDAPVLDRLAGFMGRRP